MTSAGIPPLEVAGPEMAGAPYPEWNPRAVNESAIDYDMRYKYVSVEGDTIHWCTQSRVTKGGLITLHREVARWLDEVDPDGTSTVYLHVFDRDGLDRPRLITIR